ncbi:MAG: DUF1295 domain-containing protein [bacterium]|nr:DUF1295 domain-containing protein [bacterium]
MGWELIWIPFVVALAASCMGFRKFVYFMSIGYGMAVAAIGVAFGVLSAAGVFQAGAAHYILFALLVVYGFRLSGFLLIRELKNAAYRKTLQQAASDEKRMPVFVKAAMWICVAALYVAQTSPVFFRMYNGGAVSALVWVGIAVSAGGLLLEAVADKQKSAQKAVNPDKVAMAGLYRVVRCPNYLGEIIFWTGLVLSSLDTLRTAGQWITVAIGYICIIIVMFNGAQRLEKRQMARCGDDPEYRAYADRTPILLPLVPIYHLNKKEK